ncbi:hypothetical protein ANN_03938 [Periplaneta americana]|uniref:Nuclease HARBI1 n=1 Tax=Periplaneta americana TaxID=6978 RepID=A0ABQ8T956_PERAM|nr:hypothetical protein ANN_03938 [Periplaneta americana]
MNQLLTALHFYATGCSQLTGGNYIGVSKPTAHRIIHRVSGAIASLRERYIKFPHTREEIKREQLEFYKLARFPKVVGAMNCTYIKISSPDKFLLSSTVILESILFSSYAKTKKTCVLGGNDAELYRNRK